VTDHITPWRATYRSTQLFGSHDVTYVLSQSGHMQAILNPPGNPKAKYYVHQGEGPLPQTAEEWLQGAGEQAGSWWPFWIEWLQQRSGAHREAPKKLGGKGFAATDPAPGRYVLEQA
jgi:polyhydroxyalkanoate synthase